MIRVVRIIRFIKVIRAIRIIRVMKVIIACLPSHTSVPVTTHKIKCS